jgi:hypothetical protein
LGDHISDTARILQHPHLIRAAVIRTSHAPPQPDASRPEAARSRSSAHAEPPWMVKPTLLARRIRAAMRSGVRGWWGLGFSPTPHRRLSGLCAVRGPIKPGDEFREPKQ